MSKSDYITATTTGLKKPCFLFFPFPSIPLHLNNLLITKSYFVNDFNMSIFDYASNLVNLIKFMNIF